MRRPIRYTCCVNLKLIREMAFEVRRRIEKVYRWTDRQTDSWTDKANHYILYPAVVLVVYNYLQYHSPNTTNVKNMPKL